MSLSPELEILQIPETLKAYFPTSESLTPAMRQFVQVKNRYPLALLFFQMGDFYEMFGEDAHVCARELGIALTSRDKKGIPLAGIPIHSLNTHLKKLLKKGFRVAICNQKGDATPGKGIVEREVVRVITPGTLTETDILDSESNNYLCALAFSPGRKGKEGLWGLGKCDLSTGELVVTEFNDWGGPNGIYSELQRIQPGEVLAPPSVFKKVQGDPKQMEWTLVDLLPDPGEISDLFMEQFGFFNPKAYGLDPTSPTLLSVALILGYIKETQLGLAGHIHSVVKQDFSQTMGLDPSTIRHLDLIVNSRTGEARGSLFHAINYTRTSMGARTLKKWLLYPLVHREKIEERQKKVDALLKSMGLREKIKERMSHIYDLERLSGRLSLGHILPRELHHLRQSLQAILDVYQEVENQFPGFSPEIKTESIENIVRELILSLEEDPPSQLKNGGLIKADSNPELKELTTLTDQGDLWLSKYESREKERTGIKSLKIKFNQVFGYFIEIPNSMKNLIPEDFKRKQTLVNCERYISADLKDFESKALNAKERSDHLHYQLFIELRGKISNQIPTILEAAHYISEIDALFSLAECAEKNRYTRPLFIDEKKIAIKKGRHPVVEQEIPSQQFVPNDTLLQEDNRVLGVITGPNMAGKSTFMRQVALITLLAQIGSFVPAESALLGVFDRVFTRIGASDNLSEGESTFMVEMGETANILNSCSEKSLIILDEIGRGTSTFDGLAIAWAVVEHILEKFRPLTLFATHYHEIAKLPESHSGAFNLCTAVKEVENKEILFLHQVVDGSSDQSYGIHVARLAGIPSKVIERAREILFQLENKGMSEVQKPIKKRLGATQLALFAAEKNPVLEEISKIELEQMTPLDALNFLYSLKSRLN